MMDLKKGMALCLILMLLCTGAMADIDNTVLTSVPGAQMWHLNDIDLVVRTATMPFMAVTDNDAWELNLFVDFVQLAQEGVTAIRLTASTGGEDMLFADEMQITVGKKTWRFIPSCQVNEYDMTYFEDYYVCLGQEGLAVMKALTQGKGSCTVKLVGDQTLTGKVTVPAREVKALYELYRNAGGLTQDLSAVDARWPVNTGK